jgi:hypothetical protein
MQFIVMAYVREGDWPKLTREQQQQGLAAYKAFTDAMKSAGVFVSSNGLAPGSSGTTLRPGPDGKVQVLDGPFADSKEQLGGYYIIDVKDRDEAIAWGARCPASGHGVVEVRAIAPMPTPKAAD